MKLPQIKLTIRLTICAAALLLSNQWCLAQNPCPGDTQVTPTNEQTLASQYQPYANVLARYRFAPPAPWDPPWPTVLLFPPDVFRDDNITDEGTQTERQASYDLQQAGFLVFQVETRLAPPGALPNQSPSNSGWAPEQTDDAKRQILSALADINCNGKIYLIGGSAGGTLALWCALDPASTVSGWNETARSHIKAVVSMSGPADFCDLYSNRWHPPERPYKVRNGP